MITDSDIISDLALVIQGLDAIDRHTVPLPARLPITTALARLRFLKARLEPVKPGVLVDAEGVVDLTEVTRALNSDGAIA